MIAIPKDYWMGAGLRVGEYAIIRLIGKGITLEKLELSKRSIRRFKRRSKVRAR